MKKKSGAYGVQCVIGILVVLTMLCSKYYVEGQYYASWKVLLKWLSEKRFCPEYILYLEGVLFAGLYGMRTIWLLLKKRAGVLYGLSGFCLWLSCAPFLVFTQMEDPLPYVGSCGIFLLLFLMEFMVLKFMQQRVELKEAFETSKEKEREEKEHQKRADYFPGRYPKEFYQVIRNHFRYYRKEQRIVLLSAAFISTITQVVLAVFMIAKKIYKTEGTFQIFIGDGLYGLFRKLGFVLVVLSVCMMYMICSWYIREQKKEFQLLVILGMRKRTAYLIFLCEYVGNILIGMVFGIAASAILVAGKVSFSSIGIGIAIYLWEMVIALLLNQEGIQSLGKSTDLTEDVRSDRRPEGKLSIYIGFGFFFLMAGCVWFSIREWAEMDLIHILTVGGCMLLLIGSFACFLKKRKRKEQYYQQLFRWNGCYYRFWKQMSGLCLLTAVHFCVLAIFATQLIGSMTKQNIGKMYPYDFVYKAYEEEMPQLEQLIEENQIYAEQYPMLVVTSIYGSDKLANWGSSRPIQWPQGQHIGISESSYRKLKQAAGQDCKELNLKQDEMHVVYQQDLSAKAHTIDWDSMRMEKHLRFGQPLVYYNTADFRNVFPVREIKSEERSSLIGIFGQGMNENLVVMSDTYFAEQWENISSYNRKQWSQRQKADLETWRDYTYSHDKNMTEGPTVLYCLSVPEDKREAVEKKLTQMANKNEFDRTWDWRIQTFYGKEQMVQNLESEIEFTKISYAFIVIILTLISAFQYFVFVRREEKSWKWDDIFLERIGMREKERKEKIDFQLRLYLFVPLVIGLVGGVLFMALTLKARLFTGNEVILYLQKMGIVYAAYITVQVVIYKLQQNHIRHFIEENR